MLDEAFDATERGRPLPNSDGCRDGNGGPLALSDADREHAAETADHLPQGDFVADMLCKAGIKDG